jgi:putative membrane protein (TIGR04086 family)
MTSISLSKKNLLGILVGIGTRLGIGIIITIISLLIAQYIYQISSVDDLQSNSFQPLTIYRYITQVLGLLTPIIGGFVTGKMVKEKGWLYGGLVSVFLLLISLGLVSLSFILPRTFLYGPHITSEMINQIALKNILRQLSEMPFDIILSVFGGYLGQKYSGKIMKRKV